MIKRTIEVDRFLAKSKTGREYTIILFQDVENTPENPQNEVMGLKRFRTLEGYDVSPREVPNTYFIAQTRDVAHKL